MKQESSRLQALGVSILSTLRSYVNAMGGELQLIVEFPDRPPVVLTGLAELDEDSETEEDAYLHT